MSEDSNEVDPLKTTVNSLNGEIKKIYGEITAKRRGADELKNKRDEFNSKVKTRSIEASALRDERNELNGRVSALKKEHKKLITTIRKFDDDIKQAKKKRDTLNRKARGTEKKLEEKYVASLEELITKDMPFKEEARLYERLLKFGERIEAACEATELHESVIKTYGTLKEFNKRLDEISGDIDTLSADADEKHARLLELYASLNEVKKQSDDYHNQLLAKYKEIDPLRDRIREVNDELKPLAKELDDAQATIKREEMKEAAREIKEKLQANKRVSFNDLKILLAEDEI